MENHRSTAVEDHDVPPELANSMQDAFGLDEPPATLADWITLSARLLDESGLTVGVEDMCTADESRHVAVIDGERQHFYCVLDTLLVPFFLPAESPVEVRSRSPVSDEVVELAVSRDGIEVTPAGAVMSFGFADELTVRDPSDVDPSIGYENACPYINAFPTRAEYDRWARETPGATTMAMSFPDGLELARALAERLGDGGD